MNQWPGLGTTMPRSSVQPARLQGSRCQLTCPHPSRCSVDTHLGIGRWGTQPSPIRGLGHPCPESTLGSFVGGPYGGVTISQPPPQKVGGQPGTLLQVPWLNR